MTLTQGNPKAPFLWVSITWGFHTETVHNRNCSWLRYRPSRLLRMPQATQWSSLAEPGGRYHVSHMEVAKRGNKAADSEATSFPGNGRVCISVKCKHSCLQNVQYPWNINNSVVQFSIYSADFYFIVWISSQDSHTHFKRKKNL